jgi:hypothetical protein
MEEAPSRVGIAGGQDDAQSIRALSRCVVPEDRFGDGRDSSNSNGSPIPMLEQYIRYLNRSNSA